MKFPAIILVSITLLYLSGCRSKTLNLDYSSDFSSIQSRDEDYYYTHYDSSIFYNDKNVTVEEASSIPFDYIKIVDISSLNLGEPSDVDTRYFDFSTVSLYKEDEQLIVKVTNSSNDSNVKYVRTGIYSGSYVKSDKYKNKWVILYVDDLLDNFYIEGYWIAISNDFGKSWKRYYTGLTQNRYYDLKQNSRIPLLKDSETMQIEGMIVRSVYDSVRYSKTDTIQDNIAIQFDLNKLIQDSDNDGLTDVIEAKLLTNPHNKDTDGDGVCDLLDTNPRYKSIRSDKVILYETLLENINWDKQDIFSGITQDLDLTRIPKHKKEVSTFEFVRILVTDDSEILGLDPHKSRMIIMSSSEYKTYIHKYPSHSNVYFCSPMFRCDDLKNASKINIEFFPSQLYFLVTKTKNGWLIKGKVSHYIT